MPNPRPKQTDEFINKKFKAVGTEEKLAKKTVQLKVPEDVMAELDSWTKEERIVFLRSLITNAVREKVKQAG